MTAVTAPRARSPHGTWPSPITPDRVAATAGAPTWPVPVGPETWWCAPDPTTATTRLLRCAAPGRPAVDVLGPGWGVGNGAIGYGGRPYLVAPGSDFHTVVFTHSADQRLYTAVVPALAAGAGSPAAPEPAPLTPADPDGVRTCYADPILGPAGPHGPEIWCVREVTLRPAGHEQIDPALRTRRDIVAVPLSGAAATDPAALRTVAASHHFLSGVRLSPDGTRLAWIGWDHPRVPWETTDLMVARIVDGRAAEPVRVLGGGDVAVSQAEWSGPDGLYATADPDGWWNLHHVVLAPDGTVTSENALPMASECAHAIWRVGATSFAVVPAGVVLRHGVGDQRLGLWDPLTGTLTDLAPDWTDFATGFLADPAANAVAVVAGAPTAGHTPLRIDFGSAPEPIVEPCVAADDDLLEPWHSIPERRTAVRPDGQIVHYLYYAPRNPDLAAPAGELPPLLVDVHGGPTSRVTGTRVTEFSLFTSRGYALATVDYGGSVGYGREYRDRLRHTWGVTDVADSVAVADDLAAAGLADRDRTAIRGGSAGGWTTLAALTGTDRFACGGCYYPISDPQTWYGEQTHDFESRYLHYLIGDPVADAERYRQVSPLANAARVTVPFVMLQGADDAICRPDQARRFVAAVDPGLVFRSLEFAGEGHGFRRAASVAASLTAELDLYLAVLVTAP